MADLFDQLKSIESGDLEGKASPAPKVVSWLLGNGSTTENNDVLHRLGTGAGDAAPGRHIHDGRDSPYLFEGVTLNDLPSNASTAQIIAAVNALNALMRSKGAA